MGDFNIEAAGDAFFGALKHKNFQNPPNMDSLKTNFYRTHTFDKIAWVNRKSFKHTGNCNVVPFGEAVYQEGTPAACKKHISDHLPVWAEFEINKLTQELDQIINRGE
jgi:endonuclease/exonuclease/phosphatase family metal-dependent hydrolase